MSQTINLSPNSSNQPTQAQKDGMLATLGAAALNHTHSEYALSSHTHSEYALSNHTHSDYALSSHTHSEYALSTHTHSEYATTAHTHIELTNATNLFTPGTLVKRDALGGFTVGGVAGYIDLGFGLDVDGDLGNALVTHGDASIATTGDQAFIYTTGSSAKILTRGDNASIQTLGLSAKINTTGDDAQIFTTGGSASVYTTGEAAHIYTAGEDAEIRTSGYKAKISTSGGEAAIYTEGLHASLYATGDNAFIFTMGANGTIYTNGIDASIYTVGERAAMITSGDSAYIQTNGTNAGINTQGDNGVIETYGTNARICTRGDYAIIETLGAYAGIGTSGVQATITTGGEFAKVSTSGDHAEIFTNGEYAKIYTLGANASITTEGSGAEITTFGDVATIHTVGTNASIFTTGGSASIFTTGDYAGIRTSGADALIDTNGSGAHISTNHTSAKIRSNNFAPSVGRTSSLVAPSAADTNITAPVLTWGATGTENTRLLTIDASVVTITDPDAFKTALALGSTSGEVNAVPETLVQRSIDGTGYFGSYDGTNNSVSIGDSGLRTYGEFSSIITTGRLASFETIGEDAYISTSGYGANIITLHADASVKSQSFAPSSSTTNLATLRNNSGQACLSWGGDEPTREVNVIAESLNVQGGLLVEYGAQFNSGVTLAGGGTVTNAALELDGVNLNVLNGGIVDVFPGGHIHTEGTGFIRSMSDGEIRAESGGVLRVMDTSKFKLDDGAVFDFGLTAKDDFVRALGIPRLPEGDTDPNPDTTVVRGATGGFSADFGSGDALIFNSSSNTAVNSGATWTFNSGSILYIEGAQLALGDTTEFIIGNNVTFDIGVDAAARFKTALNIVDTAAADSAATPNTLVLRSSTGGFSATLENGEDLTIGQNSYVWMNGDSFIEFANRSSLVIRNGTFFNFESTAASDFRTALQIPAFPASDSVATPDTLVMRNQYGGFSAALWDGDSISASGGSTIGVSAGGTIYVGSNSFLDLSAASNTRVYDGAVFTFESQAADALRDAIGAVASADIPAISSANTADSLVLRSSGGGFSSTFGVGEVLNFNSGSNLNINSSGNLTFENGGYGFLQFGSGLEFADGSNLNIADGTVFDIGADAATAFRTALQIPAIPDYDVTATPNSLVQRDANGDAFFGEDGTGSVVAVGAQPREIAGVNCAISSVGSGRSIATDGSESHIFTNGVNSSIMTLDASGRVQSEGFTPSLTATASLKTAGDLNVLTWGTSGTANQNYLAIDAAVVDIADSAAFRTALNIPAMSANADQDSLVLRSNNGGFSANLGNFETIDIGLDAVLSISTGGNLSAGSNSNVAFGALSNTTVADDAVWTFGTNAAGMFKTALGIPTFSSINLVDTAVLRNAGGGFSADLSAGDVLGISSGADLIVGSQANMELLAGSNTKVYADATFTFEDFAKSDFRSAIGSGAVGDVLFQADTVSDVIRETGLRRTHQTVASPSYTSATFVTSAELSTLTLEANVMYHIRGAVRFTRTASTGFRTRLSIPNMVNGTNVVSSNSAGVTVNSGNFLNTYSDGGAGAITLPAIQFFDCYVIVPVVTTCSLQYSLITEGVGKNVQVFEHSFFEAIPKNDSIL